MVPCITAHEVRTIFYFNSSNPLSELADRTGFEPVISSVTVRHVSLYTNGPKLRWFSGDTYTFLRSYLILIRIELIPPKLGMLPLHHNMLFGGPGRT